MFSLRFARWVTGASLLALATVSCKDQVLQPLAEDGREATPVAPSFAITASPPGASVSVPVEVPGSMRSAPFDVQRVLRVPPDFRVSVYARISKPRFMAVTPDGNLLVSQPGTGKVLLVRPNPNGDPTVSDWATGLYRPHDIVFHAIGGATYVYVAEGDKIARYSYASGDLTGRGRQVILSGLPSASTPELQGAYGHELKNIALDGNHKLYVSIASTCNACASDTRADPVRGSIYQYNADGSGGRLFARGLRNAEGLALVPGTNTLWVSVNNRDRIAYPFHDDWNGDGSDDYGKVMQSYVDNHPPEEFTRVRDGGNYGWPFCNPNPDTPNGFNDMPFDRDVQYNADGSWLNCETADRISKGIQAHSAPLGLLFLQNTRFPDAYRAGAAIAYHGSWNRSVKTGYEVAYFPWDGVSQRPGEPIDLVTGWAGASSSWGRPVDIAVDAQGSMFISDDQAGAIYRLTYTPPALPPPSPWASRDVGSVAAAGSVAFADGTFTVRGSGRDIWGSADEFRFAYQPLNGDGEVVARVASQGNTDPWAKAGVMIREGLGANARHGMVVVSPGNGVAFQRRSSSGGSSTHTAGGSGTAPVWVRLVRTGNTLFAYRSADGRTWTAIGSSPVTMSATAYIGLAVTSHNDGRLSTATFDNVRLTP